MWSRWRKLLNARSSRSVRINPRRHGWARTPWPVAHFSVGWNFQTLFCPDKGLADKGFLQCNQGDRFIPNRSAMDLEVAHFNLLREFKENNNANMDIFSPVKVGHCLTCSCRPCSCCPIWRAVCVCFTNALWANVHLLDPWMLILYSMSLDQEEYKRQLAENLFQVVGAMQTPKILAFNKRLLGSPLEVPLSTDTLASPTLRVRQIPQVVLWTLPRSFREHK